MIISKTLPLLIGVLKSFFRDRISVFLLIIFPLGLISSLFLSFNPDGIQRIPIGFVRSEAVDITEYSDTYFSYLAISEYDNLGACIDDLYRYRQYVCIDVLKGNAITLRVHYDNTREPVIWEIIERIKGTILMMQKEKSKKMATDFIEKFSKNLDKIDGFSGRLQTANKNLDGYIYKIDDSIRSLTSARSELESAIASMDSDISSVKSLRNEIGSKKQRLYSEATDSLEEIIEKSASLSNLSYIQQYYVNQIISAAYETKEEIDSYNSQTDSSLYSLDVKIRSYESASSRGKSYVGKIQRGGDELKSTKGQISSYKEEIWKIEDDLSQIKSDMQEIGEMDPELLVNPILVENIQTYVPLLAKAKDEPLTKEEIKKVIKGVNLITLQTIYPKLLLLITLFLSLLLSSYICLTQINSPANPRIRLVRSVFFPEIFSVYLSSLTIMILPLVCVTLLGQFLFRIQIYNHFILVASMLFLLSSIFIFIGMSLAYLIKKGSITILVTTFILVLFIFYSGILLPIERMSPVVGYLANLYAGNIALIAFTQLVFYGHQDIFWALFALSLWFISLFLSVVLIKFATKR